MLVVSAAKPTVILCVLARNPSKLELCIDGSSNATI